MACHPTNAEQHADAKQCDEQTSWYNILMPYFITDRHPECPRWAVVKERNELVACHDTKNQAIAQMVAISANEGIEPGGELE